MNAYVSECSESECAINTTRRMRRILDAKYKKSDLKKAMTEQCQHLNAKECEIILNLISKYEELFDGTLGTWNTTPLDLGLRDDANPV